MVFTCFTTFFLCGCQFCPFFLLVVRQTCTSSSLASLFAFQTVLWCGLVPWYPSSEFCFGRLSRSFAAGELKGLPQQMMYYNKKLMENMCVFFSGDAWHCLNNAKQISGPIWGYETQERWWCREPEDVSSLEVNSSCALLMNSKRKGSAFAASIGFKVFAIWHEKQKIWRGSNSYHWWIVFDDWSLYPFFFCGCQISFKTRLASGDVEGCPYWWHPPELRRWGKSTCAVSKHPTIYRAICEGMYIQVHSGFWSY